MAQIIAELQAKCAAAGFSCGVQDGDLGPKTYAAFLNAVVGRDLGALGVLLGRGMASDFQKYQITTPRRICHWVAQGAHETNGFRSFVEKGNGDGPDADPWDDYLEKYDFRADLGNSHGGDGEKYRGRGIFQLTGAANYKRYGYRLGIDLLGNPQRAAEPEIAVTVACLFWTDKGLNAFADADDVKSITRKINGGYNGLDQRTAYLKKGEALWGI